MQDFILSGRAVDLVLVVIAIEFCVLIALQRSPSRRGALDVFFALAPGVMLLLALRAALVGADWRWVALLMAGSFPFHLIDLARRR